MYTKPLFSRQVFKSIVEGCIEVLRKHGLTQRITPPHNCFISAAFEKKCFGYFGDVLPEAPRHSITPNLTSDDLNRITIECALVFHDHGVPRMRIGENLDCIRATLIDVIREMGYEIPSDVSILTEQPHWLCYVRWEKLARKEGVSEENIAKTREWRKHCPSHSGDRPVAV